MTFKEFKSLVNEYNKANNKNITVSQHETMSGNKNKIAVIFDNSSKIYYYTGSYQDVLSRLGINTLGKNEILKELNNLYELLRIATTTHNKKSVFSKTKINKHEEIKTLCKKIRAFKQKYNI